MDKLLLSREKINKIDEQMARLFAERMEAVRNVAKYKAEKNLPIFDASREAEIIERNSALIKDEGIKAHYINFLNNNMEISRSYQAELYPELVSGVLYEKDNFKKIRVSLQKDSYDIFIGCGLLSHAREYLKLDRKVLVLTDSGVPTEYAKLIADQCKESFIYTVEQGEASKNFESFRAILEFMAQNRFTRTDCVIAVGGGVCGDLAGFVAASYMRGVDFYNVPTTLLSQVDSSIGGKVAIDLDGYKNTVGAFYQPKVVLIDPETLLTLDIRQVRSGFAESLKMATTSDAELFELFESGEYLNDIEEIILRSLLIKKGIVERDVNEKGERKILNFGHTIGHAIESTTSLIHGEAVALGMLFMCGGGVRTRLLPIIEEMGLPTETEIDVEKLFDFILRDKKADGDSITITFVNEIGKAELRRLPIEDIKDLIDPSIYGGIQ
ncbi:MAG: 3-dehydroquinate synthase [Clostridia bacterium]|nr:3-dehydroquinate synthase [Clostridia bacterium]